MRYEETQKMKINMPQMHPWMIYALKVITKQTRLRSNRNKKLIGKFNLGLGDEVECQSENNVPVGALKNGTKIWIGIFIADSACSSHSDPNNVVTCHICTFFEVTLV